MTASKASTPTSARQSRTREIRTEIEQTREDLSETVNAIQDRLQPSTLASNAVDSVKDAARERFRDFADAETVQYVRANPMPTAMIGIGLAGLAWLALGVRRRTPVRATGMAGETGASGRLRSRTRSRVAG